MTPEQQLIAKWLGFVLFLVAIFFAGFYVRGYMAEKDALEVANQTLVDVATLAADYQTKVEERDARNQELQSQLHALDAAHQRTLNDQLAENDALRGDLAVAQRMQLKGTSCPKGSPAAGETPAAGVDTGVPVVLSAETRHAVFDLRASILRDKAALEACKSYALTN